MLYAILYGTCGLQNIPRTVILNMAPAMERNTLQLVYAMTGVVSGKVRTSLIILGSGASVPQRISSTEI